MRMQAGAFIILGLSMGLVKHGQQKAKNEKRRIQNEIGTPQQVGSRDD
jgi:hypothetical protein